MEEKTDIARTAAALVDEGDSIILDSGSTTTELARQLVQYKSLNVLTNALNIAMMLGENPGISLLVSGGEFKAPTLSLTGEVAAKLFKGIHVNKLFLATAGISPDDFLLTYPSLSDLSVKSAMIRAASKVYLLADSSKIGRPSFASLGRISLIDTLITDDKIDTTTAARIEELGVKIIIANKGNI